MPLYYLDNGVQVDISNLVQRETIKVENTLSVDVDARGGESVFHCILTVDPTAQFKPRLGCIITWIADNNNFGPGVPSDPTSVPINLGPDSTNYGGANPSSPSGLTLFSGIITSAIQTHEGFSEVIQYSSPNQPELPPATEQTSATIPGSNQIFQDQPSFVLQAQTDQTDTAPPNTSQFQNEVLKYSITARDASVLLEKKYIEPGIYNQKNTAGAIDTSKIKGVVTGTPQAGYKGTPGLQKFPDFIGDTPGQFVDLLAVAAEPRFGLPVDNDNAGDNDVKVPANYHVGRTRTVNASTDTFRKHKNYHLGRMTYKDAIDQITREAGLLWWVDAEWNFHHKSFPTIVNTPMNEYFNITETNQDGSLNTNYYGFTFDENIEKWVTRVKVYGNAHDAGDVNPQNRKQGKAKTEEVEVVATAGIENINAVRERIGYDPLPLTTNPDTLSDFEPGIWIATVNAPNVYVEKTSGDPDPTRPDYNLLKEIGYAYLLRYGQPDIQGEVYYNDFPPQIGTSILIDCPTRGINQIFVPIVAVEIESAGEHQGNDETGQRVYQYKAQFRGPSMHARFARLPSSGEIRRPRPEKLIKPGVGQIIGSDVYAESAGPPSSQVQAITTVSAAVILPNYTQTGTPLSSSYNNVYPNVPGTAPTGSGSSTPIAGAAIQSQYYPPMKQPWTLVGAFGNSTEPVTGTSAFSNGILISSDIGTPVYSVTDGIVSKINPDPNNEAGGKYIQIQGNDGSLATYMYLKDINVPQGQQVYRSQLIGTSGTTSGTIQTLDGTQPDGSPNPQFFFSLSLNGTPVDPQSIAFYDDRESS